jgi:hypothetical protein
MPVKGRSGAQGLEESSVRPPATLRAMQVLLWVLAVLGFAQPVFAGLLLDWREPWRDLHAINGERALPLLTLVLVILAVVAWRASFAPGWMAWACVGTFLILIAQNVTGVTSVLSVHVPLGVAYIGVIGALIARIRTLVHAPAAPRKGRMRTAAQGQTEE